MIVSNDYNFTFIAIPKTGTRSLVKILQNEYNGELIAKYEHFTDVPDIHKTRFTFTTVRNPYERICSAYWFSLKDPSHLHKQWMQDMKSKKLKFTLENYLQTIKDYTGTYHHPGIQQSLYFKHIKYDKVLRLEHINNDFNSLPFVKTPVAIPRNNSSFSKAAVRQEELLTPKVIELVNEIYQDDFKLFGYNQI